MRTGNWLVRARVLAALTVLGSAFLGGAPSRADDAAQACENPTRRITMYAEQLPSTPQGKIRLGWGLTPDTAQTPGPLMEMYEGECLAITVVNDVPASTLAALRDDPVLGSGDPTLPLGVSLHVHGVKYFQASDGTVDTGSWVAPGAVRTYRWYAAPRIVTAGRVTSQGTAGYWWYHDHVVGTDHGTAGVASGMWGGLVVRRAGDITPDRTFVVGMGPDATLNLRHYPATDTCDKTNPVPSNTCLVAVQGQRIEFLVLGYGDDFHTFHLHAHNWADNRTGILQSPIDDTRLIDNKTVGPADSFGFQVIAGEDTGTGNWMLHCHVQAHSDRGMMTFLHVLPNPSAPLPPMPGLNLAPPTHHHAGH
jgi:manganese oxidase